jgi:peptide methionine sulfoxide reductase MsrB
MEKEYWDKFVKIHSVATAIHVKSVLGKKVTEEEFITEHRDTCKSKHYSANQCGKGLFKFLNKFNYINN